MHDFNAGITSNGLWWLVKVPDDAVKVEHDPRTDAVTVHVDIDNVAILDQFQFPGGAGNNLGMDGVPATVSYHATFVTTGAKRKVSPTTRNGLSPFSWAGEMWPSSNSGTFSVRYRDGTFAAQGNFDSTGNFGEVGYERNGSYLTDDDFEHNRKMAAANVVTAPSAAPLLTAGGTALEPNTPKLRGKVPVESLIH